MRGRVLRLAAGLLALLVLAGALGAAALLAGQAAHHCDGDDACPVCMGLRLAANLVWLLAAGLLPAAGLALAGLARLCRPVRVRRMPVRVTPVGRRVRLNN